MLLDGSSASLIPTSRGNGESVACPMRRERCWTSAGETPARAGEEESAGVNRSKRSPKRSRQMRRILNQSANAAVKHKGSIFEIVYRRLILRLGHNKAIGAVAHRLCKLIWIILHNGVRYEERGPSVCEKAKRVRTSRMIRTLRALGCRVEPAVIPA